MYKIHSIAIDYDNAKLIINGKEIKSTAIIGIADESTEKWLGQKVINMHHATENLLKIAVYCEEVHQATEEPLTKGRSSHMREIKATFPDGTREKERISESVGLQQWRDIETGDLKVGGRLFTGESIERATQIEKALEGLTIREAYDLLDRVKTHLLNSIVSPDR